MSELIDNRANRIRMLKDIIKHLHAGEAPEAVKAQLASLVRECDAGEIAAMEQQLMDEGVPATEIMGMCDLHSQVVRDILVERPTPPIPTGHPVDTFKRENIALQEKAAALRGALAAPDLDRARALFNELMDVDKHYQRKEHLLFSCLERHDITGPSKVMWGKDDEARSLLRLLGETMKLDAPVAQVRAAAEPALAAVEEMIAKEEKILLPMALQTLTAEEWGEIFTQSPQFGWCLIDPGDGYDPPDVVDGRRDDAPGETRIALDIVPPVAASAAPTRGSLIFPTGSMTLDQLKAIFSTLPVDLTFVDADDRVRFVSDGPDRVFARPLAVIGRKVQHCHPPGSLDVVNRIVGDFRSGRQDVAEFWISLQGRFVHIRYFALRDERGEYLGTLEVTQDASSIRNLEGERRLLEYA